MARDPLTFEWKMLAMMESPISLEPAKNEAMHDLCREEDSTRFVEPKSFDGYDIGHLLLPHQVAALVKLWCATTNAGKLREFQLLGTLFGTDVEALPKLRDIAPSAEDGDTFEANAAQKAIYYSRFTEGLLFADDSGLEVDALHGEPGVRSARFAGEHADDAANNALLIERLQGETDRRARFVCVIALARAGQVMATYRGEVDGEILREPRGNGGFGYDPYFFYPPLNRGLAELSEEEKFAISHRGKALRMMLSSLDRQS